MWEEYAVPGFIITFVLGILLGINIGMMCVPRMFEPHCMVGQNYMKAPDVAPLRYPSGYTVKQLQQNDFVRRPSMPSGMPSGMSSGMSSGRMTGGISGSRRPNAFTY